VDHVLYGPLRTARCGAMPFPVRGARALAHAGRRPAGPGGDGRVRPREHAIGVRGHGADGVTQMWCAGVAGGAIFSV